MVALYHQDQLIACQTREKLKTLSPQTEGRTLLRAGLVAAAKSDYFRPIEAQPRVVVKKIIVTSE
jgi:hypothetical protein